MAIIEIENLTYSYPHTDQPALRDLILQIEAGEFVAVIGANGAGKSTLCYTLTGFVPHFFQGEMVGRVSVAGLETREHPLEDLVLVSGLVFQNPFNQISGAKFTVYEEIAFGLENLGVPREEMAPRIKQVMALTDITEMADRSPYALSGGQQQRVALASMLVMEPQVLVLDEPTSQLDPLGSREVFAVIRELSRQGHDGGDGRTQTGMGGHFCRPGVCSGRWPTGLEWPPSRNSRPHPCWKLITLRRPVTPQ